MVYLYFLYPILQFFKLRVVDGNGILNESNLVAALKDVSDRSCAPGKPVGILTGNDRDTWAEDSSTLLGFILSSFLLFSLHL